MLRPKSEKTLVIYNAVNSDLRDDGIYRDSMPTAIVIIYTREGFVAVSDGKGNKTQGASEHETKLFPIAPPNRPSWRAIYGLIGAASLIDRKTGKDDFKEIYQDAVTTLENQSIENLADYADRFAGLVGPQLYKQFECEHLFSLPQNQPAKSYFIIIPFAGYFNGIASLVVRRLSFCRDKWSVTRLKNSIHAKFGECYIYGSEAVAEELLNPEATPFAQFKTEGFHKVKMGDASISLQEAKNAATKYIDACDSPAGRAADLYCESIGGDRTITVVKSVSDLEWEIRSSQST